MAAATTDREIARQPGELVAATGVSGEVYYAGTMLHYSGASSDELHPAERGMTDSFFAGVAINRVDLSGGDAGASADTIKMWKTGEFTFAANGTGASAHIGQIAYILDDQTVGTSIASPKSEAGIITGLVSTSEYRVRVTNAVDKVSV